MQLFQNWVLHLESESKYLLPGPQTRQKSTCLHQDLGSQAPQKQDLQLEGKSEEEMSRAALLGFVFLSFNVQMADGQQFPSRAWAEEHNSNSRLSHFLPNLRNSTARISAGQRTMARDRSCECCADAGLEEMSK